MVDKKEKSLISLFTRLAKDILSQEKGGKIFQSITLYDLPIEITVLWGSAVPEDDEED